MLKYVNATVWPVAPRGLLPTLKSRVLRQLQAAPLCKGSELTAFLPHMNTEVCGVSEMAWTTGNEAAQAGFTSKVR